MHSDSKRLFNNITALGTLLRCPIGGDFLIPTTSAFSLVFEYIQKHSPSCIRDAFTKMFILDHILNVKIFYCKAIVIFNKRGCNFMTKIKSLVGNLFVMIGKKNTSFFSTVRAFLSTRNSFLCFYKFSFCLSKILRWLYLLSITGGNKIIKSNINANFFPSCRKMVIICQVKSLTKGGYASPLTAKAVSSLA